MQAAEFVLQVQRHAGLKTSEQAMNATDATLETLGERLDRTRRGKLAAQLPGELKEILLRSRQTQRYLLNEFYNRVAARASLGYPHAVSQAKSVMAILREAVSVKEIEHVLADLPEEYEEFLGEEEEVGV